MNYLMEIKRFYDRQLSANLKPVQIAVWHALMEINNRCGWQEWFKATWSTIMSMSGISRNGLSSALTVLEEKGYISRNEYGEFKIESLTRSQSRSQSRSQFDTQSETKNTQTPIIYNKQNKTKQNKTEDEFLDSFSLKL